MMDQKHAVEAFVTYLVKNLVDEPDAVNINFDPDRQDLLLEISVAQNDIGKVVGRRGQTIKALRLIASLTAQRVGLRVRLEVIDKNAKEADEAEAMEDSAADETSDELVEVPDSGNH